MFPDPKTARILALEHQALVPLFEKMKGLAVLSRAGRLEALTDCQQRMEQFRAAYAERSNPSAHTERMLELLNDKLTEIAEAATEPQEGVTSRNGNNCTLRILSCLPHRPESAVLDLFTLAPNVVTGQVDVLPAQR